MGIMPTDQKKKLLWGSKKSIGTEEDGLKGAKTAVDKRLSYGDVIASSFRDPNLHFVESPALASPKVEIDIAAQQQHEPEFAVPASQPLSDDDDDAFE
ncbi:unnamed protein product [Lactuca virosa]|uniref:Uncharacterized protein n=1 Tax=Lactuca virosa TaxID=75947 RepID=A0AAU9PAE5_9ASTR|nr:unnamed protein product [Lactuca virosa]